jgi:glycosyltransferase involved in cell wall biosynthesis
MPVGNGMPWLREALAGLSSQTFGDFEILALEDGSTDETPQVLASWPDPRLRTIRTGGIGTGAALALGLREARAPLVARQDAEDSSMPQRFERQVAFLDRCRHIDLVGCLAEYVDESGRPLDSEWVRAVRAEQDVAVTPPQIRDLLPRTCCLTHGSVVARADILRAVGGYRVETTPVEDYDLWLRLLPERALAKLPERLYRYRVRAGRAGAPARPDHVRQTIAARLAYVRRVMPGLPDRATLAIVGGEEESEACRTAAADAGFTVVPARATLGRNCLSLLGRPAVRRWALEGWDVLAVADESAIEAYGTKFSDTGQGLVRVGSFFVKQEYAQTSRPAAAA